MKKPFVHKPVSANRKAHQIRIIGGQWKRTPLTVIDADGLRPTPDRVRETLFNWLGHLFDANWQGRQVLDMFAGSGALGFEAASRGALAVTLVESHTPAFRQLEDVKQKLQATQITLLRGDALTVVQGMLARQQTFDLIFLDPPFDQGLLPKVAPLCIQLLSKNGFLYVEAEQLLAPAATFDTAGPSAIPATPDWLKDWRVIRADKAGSVFFHVLQRVADLHVA